MGLHVTKGESSIERGEFKLSLASLLNPKWHRQELQNRADTEAVEKL